MPKRLRDIKNDPNSQNVLITVLASHFSETIRGSLQRHWNVELWSWKSCFDFDGFEEIRQEFPNQITIHYLDQHRGKITYTQKKPVKK